MLDHTPFFPKNLEDYAPWVATHGLVAPYGKCQCGCGNDAPIAPKTRNFDGVLRGKPIRFVSGHSLRVRQRPRVERRFWAKVDKRGPKECWEWQGRTNRDGYGFISYKGNVSGVHRVSYEMHGGYIPVGKEVCHSCDNPKCVNPGHLWVGTHAENIADMMRKKRHAALKGEANGNAKLTEADVIAIRELKKDGFLGREIAPMYGVSVALIHKVCTGEAWGHIR